MVIIRIENVFIDRYTLFVSIELRIDLKFCGILGGLFKNNLVRSKKIAKFGRTSLA